MKWKRLVISVVMFSLGAGLWAACGSPQNSPPAAAAREPRAITVRVAPAIIGNISVSTAYAAIVEAKDQVNLVPLTTGRVEKLNVDIGSEVQRGQVVAELSHGILDAQLQQAEAALRNAQARLAVVLGTGEAKGARVYTPLDVTRAKLDQLLNPSTADLQVAESTVTKAQAELDSAKAKLDQLLNPSAADLQAAESAVATAQANLDSARTKLAQLLHPSASDLQAADSAVATAQANLDSARTKLAQLLNPSAADVAAAQKDVADAQSDLTTAQKDLNQAIPTLLKESLTAEQRLWWQMLRDARLSRQANTDKLSNLHQAFGWTPSSQDIANAQKVVEKNQAVIASLLEQLNSASLIPQDIRIEMWDEVSAQAALDSAKTKLNTLQSPDQKTVALSQDNVAKEQAALDAAKAKLKALQSPDQNTKALAQDNIAKEQAALDTAKAKLKALREPDRNATALAEYNVSAAQASLGGTVAKLNSLKNPDPAAVAAAGAAVTAAEQEVVSNQALVDQARAQVNLVKQQLTETQILAPFDGFVTRRWLAPGAMASPQTPVVTLVGKEVAVSLRVEETSIGAIQKGQRVTFTSPALLGQRLDLQVDQISPAGDEKAHTFFVQMRPADATPGLKPGMSGEVSIATRREKVVLVPKQAVLYRSGQSILFVIQDGKAQLRKVDGGLIDNKNLEIQNGVQPDDQVVVSGQNLLNEGDLVTVEAPADRRRPPG